MPDPVYEAIAHERRENAKVEEMRTIRIRLDTIDAALSAAVARLDALMALQADLDAHNAAATPKPRKS